MKTATNHEMSVVPFCRRCVMFLPLTLCLLGMCLPLADSFSPPICPCHYKEVQVQCPRLRAKNCEIAYDVCGCCPKCALEYNEPCEAFGIPCKNGLVCLWDRFWYNEPISGKCVYSAYIGGESDNIYLERTPQEK